MFARDLVNPRILAVSEDGQVYVSRRSENDVLLLKDSDRDGRADEKITVATKPGLHGIAITGRTMFLVANKDLYKAEIQGDGKLGELTRLISDLPDAGQHRNRTIGVGPDGMLYVSVGSTCNECEESNPENATLLRLSQDGKMRTIFASGLRNTIGFAWHPATGELFGMDHGIDWLGDNEQFEELNHIRRGKQYGWPFVYDNGRVTPQSNPPGAMTPEKWREISENPVLTYTAHSAPMQMIFYTGSQFPAEYQGDAFVAMHGSWNRRPPSGYEVVRIRFKDSKPERFEPFLRGFLVRNQRGYGYLGRPFGLAQMKDGSLLVGDSMNGVIYRVSYTGPSAAKSERPTLALSNPPRSSDPEPSDIAIRLVKAPVEDAKLTVTSPTLKQGEQMPPQHSAYGDDASPHLAWSGTPKEAKSFAIVMDDPDAAVKPFTHWVAWNIPAHVQELREALPTAPLLKHPAEIAQGRNTRGSVGYFGPKPPHGDPPHHYHFQVFALDRMLDLKPTASREELLRAIEGHVLAAGELVPTFAQK